MFHSLSKELISGYFILHLLLGWHWSTSALWNIFSFQFLQILEVFNIWVHVLLSTAQETDFQIILFFKIILLLIYDFLLWLLKAFTWFVLASLTLNRDMWIISPLIFSIAIKMIILCCYCCNAFKFWVTFKLKYLKLGGRWKKRKKHHSLLILFFSICRKLDVESKSSILVSSIMRLSVQMQS